jgi:NADH-quinone oxidoreductase subunit M
MFPDAAQHPTVITLMLSLGVIGILYAAWVAAVQPDAKKLVAYTSVAHMGFVVIGIFAFTINGLQGALLVMISHGISTGAGVVFDLGFAFGLYSCIPEARLHSPTFSC